MRYKNLIYKGTAAFFVCVGMAAVISWSLTGSAKARPAITAHPSQSFGLTSGQAARVSVVNPDLRERQSVIIQFHDENGNNIRSARAVIGPKQTFGLLLPYSEIGRAEPRVQIRAVAFLEGTDQNRLLGGVEVVDEINGRTSFGLLLPAVSEFDSQPDPPAPQ